MGIVTVYILRFLAINCVTFAIGFVLVRALLSLIG
jgi:hypothetical protein